MNSIETPRRTGEALLSGDTVLVQTSCCTVREQEEQHLFYNTQTDEMHLIPKTGAYIYELCDGLTTINDIEGLLHGVLGGDRLEITTLLMKFLEQLVARGLLEEDHESSITDVFLQ